ncbi:hypothetical protein CC80DRAFT_397288 [Byssothecium circinans]|uniref:Zn(2)-C6 fungal-type domain-containing protein n=1 Tax=Byssothecium circinans TaxID=147558 RepID=A0A6A5UQK5_9PLEO|nr:hypothetical protein CC80DRAFT_397288 [Byssothecium circinans]
MARRSFMDLSTDIKSLIVEHIIRPTDLKNICLVCKQLHEIAARSLYREVTLDIGSPNDTRLGAFLSPKNIGLQHIRKLDLYLADVVDKCNQVQQANFAIRMILELLPENILEKFSWHPWSPFNHENLILLYKKQKRMKWLEGIALEKNVLEELQKIPDFEQTFQNVRKLGLYPDSREVLDFCHMLVKNSPKAEKITLHASFEENESPISNRELNDSSTGPGLITSTMFSHMQPFDKCTPLALKDVTLQKISLRYASSTYCKLINFRSVTSIKIFACPGADAFFAELSRSTLLPDKLETLEFKHDDNNEQDGIGALDGFLCLVSGIQNLTIDLTYAKSMPAAAGIVRHSKTLRQLNVHAGPNEDCDDELIYDYSSFSQICKECSLLEQVSVGFPPVSLIRSKQDSFVNYENCLGDLSSLVTLNITTWPNNHPSSTKLPRKVYEHLLQGLAQQGFERSATYAAAQDRSSKLAIIAWGSSDKVYDREDSQNQMIFVKGKQIDPLGTESFTATTLILYPSLREIIGNVVYRFTCPQHQMASQYPPPPGSDEPHYTPIYPAPPPPQQQQQNNAQQQLGALNGEVGSAQQPRMYPQDMFPKLDNIHDVLQQQAQHANHALSDPRMGTSPTAAQVMASAEHQQQKTNRLRKACDSCSVRKCDEAGPPCRACASLDIPCTFDRPSRRRGPPNRHAEAIKKKRRLDEGLGSEASNTASPTNAAHALAQLSTRPPQLSAESICPIPTMNALIDDFFTYIHPLCPFPHEPSFREAWDNREDARNPAFLALLASMIAAMVASFPRKPRLHLSKQKRDYYPSHLSLVDKCREVCAQARGVGYLDRSLLNVYDACTSYFLGLTGAYIFQWRQLRLYFGECLTILRSLGLHKAQEQGYTHLGGLPQSKGSNGPRFEGSKDTKLDKITEQIGRRLFWTLFAGVRTMQQLGASFGELNIAPSTPTEPLPPLPLEVDDACIFPTEIHSQPAGVVPEVTGFNINARIYLSYSTLSTTEMAYGSDELFDWDRQQRMLDDCLQRCKQTFENIPDCLHVRNNKNGQNSTFGQRKKPYFPPMPEFLGMRDPALNGFHGPESQEARRASQYEIQKANIYATHLSIRSYIVEKYFVLLEKSNNARTQMALQSSPGAPITGLDRILPTSTPAADELERRMSDEREQVIKDLLVVLGSIDMVNMEPNGDSFVSLISSLSPSKRPLKSILTTPTLQTQKIRSIASTLLEVPKERKGSVALQHQEYLYKFLDILIKLERNSPETSDPNSVESVVDEEAELRHWADLKEYQLKFQEQGGIYGFS